MTNPYHNPAPRFVAGAIDLGEIKARADARRQAEEARAQQARAAGLAGAGTGASTHPDGTASNAAPYGTGPGGAAGSSGGAAAGGPGASEGGAGVAPAIHVLPENFEDDVLRRSTQVPVIVVVISERSQDSLQLARDLTELAHEDATPVPTWIAAVVNADTHPELAQAFGVRGIPTVIAVAGGRPLTNFEGGQPREALRGFIDAVHRAVAGKLPGIPPEEAGQPAPDPDADPRVAQIHEALAAGDWDTAEALCDALLAENSSHETARALRMVAILRRRVAHATAPAADGEQTAAGTAAAAGSSTDSGTPGSAAAAGSSDAAVPEQLTDLFLRADQLMLSGEHAAAFALLTDTLAVSAGDIKAAVKDRLIELLGYCDPADETVITARRNMASALF